VKARVDARRSQHSGSSLLDDYHDLHNAGAGFLGVLKDEMGQAPGVGTVEAPITAYPSFEHMEVEAQRLLPEQLKMMLKALARSNELGGEAGYPAALAALYALNLPPISTLVSRTFAAC
jgi:hypothetical protein